MDAYVMVILREIQLECHKQIGIERKGGRAIQEEELSPYPQKSDFDGELLQHQNLAQLVESTSAAEDPQISVEEVIENASSASDIEDDRTEQTEQNVSPRGRLSAFFLPCATGTMKTRKAIQIRLRKNESGRSHVRIRVHIRLHRQIHRTS